MESATRCENLPQTLRRLAWLIEQGSVQQRHADRLAGALSDTVRALERDQAILELAGLFPPSRSRWSLAGAVVAALSRFEGTTWRRIKGGGREGRSELERAMARVLGSTGGVPCQRSIWTTLKDFRATAISDSNIETALSKNG